MANEQIAEGIPDSPMAWKLNGKTKAQLRKESELIKCSLRSSHVNRPSRGPKSAPSDVLCGYDVFVKIEKMA